jgi:hypothetical protein
MASPQPTSTFGFRQSGQTPGGHSHEPKPIASFDFLGTTPVKPLPAGEGPLSSPRYELQSPARFPLFQPSPKKPVGSSLLATPPSGAPPPPPPPLGGRWGGILRASRGIVG